MNDDDDLIVSKRGGWRDLLNKQDWHNLRWVVAGSTLFGTWLLALVSFSRRDMMSVHNFSMNIIRPSTQPQRLFHMSHRTIHECPLEVAVDNKWAAWKVARVGRHLRPPPAWTRPYRRLLWGPPAASPNQTTRIIRLPSSHAHRSVMTSLLNRSSSVLALPFLYEAVGLPVIRTSFVLALTCEHEKVWFSKTRTIITSERALQQVVQLIKAGHPVDGTDVELEAPAFSARLSLLRELALAYDANPDDFVVLKLTVPLYDPVLIAQPHYISKDFRHLLHDQSESNQREK